MKFPTLQELAEERRKVNQEKRVDYAKSDKFARVVENEKKSLEFPNAIIADPNEIRSVQEFYADGKANEKNNNNANSDVKFAALFKRYGTPEFTAEIVQKLTNKLSAAEKTWLVQNKAMLDKQIKENLSNDTSIPFFIDFIEGIVVERKDKFNTTSRMAQLKKSLRTLLDAAKAKEPNGSITYANDVFTLMKASGGVIGGFGPTAAKYASIVKVLEEIRRIDTVSGENIIIAIANDYAPAAVAGSGLNSGKKYIKRARNLRIVKGGGMEIQNPKDKVSKNAFNNNKEFYELNKFIIDVDKLQNSNICDIRYKLNGRKLRQFVCPNDKIKNMIVNLCLHKTFSIRDYDKND